MTEEKYIFYIEWSRVDFIIDEEDIFSRKVQSTMMRKLQKDIWQVVTKTLFGLIKEKTTDEHYSQKLHRVSSDGTKNHCENLLKAFEDGKSAQFEEIKGNIIRKIPFTHRRKLSKSISKKTTKISKVLDTLEMLFIFVDYGVCKESDFDSSLD